MKLYRYRPLNNFLFKGLLYNELHFTSPEELNDPLDLNGQFNFYTKNEDKILPHFIKKFEPKKRSKFKLIQAS